MGLIVERQKPMSIHYDGIQFDEAFRSDLVPRGKVVVELKSVAALADHPPEAAPNAAAFEWTQTWPAD